MKEERRDKKTREDEKEDSRQDKRRWKRRFKTRQEKIERREERRQEERMSKTREETGWKRREKMKEKIKRDKGDFFFLKNVWEPPNPADESAHHVSKKIPLGRIIPPFFLRKFRIWPCFQLIIYISNSIFRARGMNSEIFSGRTV